MGITSKKDYVKFYLELDMRNKVNLISFVNNEKMILKSKIENKSQKKERIQNGIIILDELIKEIEEIGEKGVLEKYEEL